MTPPRNSPLTVQDEVINGLNGMNGMNGIINGHVDHHSYNGRAARPRRDLAPVQSQPPGASSYQQFDYGYPSDPTGYYR